MIYSDVLDAVRDEIRTLNLPGISEDEIVVEEMPADSTIVRYGVTISRDKERVLDNAALGMDRIGYPCVVTVNVGEAKDADDIEDETDRRILIRRAFHNKREPMWDRIGEDGTWILPCKVEFGPVNLSDFWEQNWSTSQMVIWCWFDENRTGLCS